MKKLVQTTAIAILIQFVTIACQGKIHITTQLPNVTLNKVTIRQHSEYPIPMPNTDLQSGKTISVAPEHYTVKVECSIAEKEEIKGRFTITPLPKRITLQAEDVIADDQLEIVRNTDGTHSLQNNTFLKE